MVLPGWLLFSLAVAALAWLFVKGQNKEKEQSYSHKSQKAQTRGQGVQCSLDSGKLPEIWHTEEGECFHLRPDCQDLRNPRKVFWQAPLPVLRLTA